MANLDNVRTLEDVINLLSILFFNLDKINNLYYDMFINPKPMTLALERMDENGIITTVSVDNRAKDLQLCYSGIGNPNGKQGADVGSLYIDTQTHEIYYKSQGSGDSGGWVLIWSSANLESGTNFLAPNGDGSNLTNLSASQITQGVLSVTRGGTGSTGISGLVKGNGQSAYTTAVDGVDYLGPTATTGIICYYPIESIPSGWLPCMGGAYSRTVYSRLFNIIGTTFGAGDGSTTFNVPDLRDYFIRCWDGVAAVGSIQESNVGKHSHGLNLSTGEGSPHTHTKGTFNIVGTFGPIQAVGETISTANAFSVLSTGTASTPSTGSADYAVLAFNGEDGWTGETSAESLHTHPITGATDYNTHVAEEVRVKNKMMVPIIKY